MSLLFSVKLGDQRLRDFISLRVSASLNNPRVLELQVALGDLADFSGITRNTVIQVYYEHDDLGQTDLLFRDSFWVRTKRITIESGVVTITAYSSLIHLQGRDIIAKPKSAAAVKAGPADRLLYEYVAEQASLLAASNRQGPVGVRGIPNGSGPTVSQDAPRRNLLSVLKAISADSIQQGQPYYFDVEYATDGYWFTVYERQRGTDRTDSGSPFSADRETLRDVEVTDDWSSEANAIIVVGQGQDDNQVAVEVADPALNDTTGPTNRVEKTIQQGQTNSVDVLTGAGRVELWKARARRSITGTLINTERARFGIDWDLGDRIVIQVLEEAIEAIIDTVTIEANPRTAATVRATFRTERLI